MEIPAGIKVATKWDCRERERYGFLDWVGPGSRLVVWRCLDEISSSFLPTSSLCASRRRMGTWSDGGEKCIVLVSVDT